jgi:NAD(P)-dependent dehydrogenase (short-subunit alcohol dehydrogenase family)
VIVTGATGGIGMAIVEALTQAGATVAGCDAPGAGAGVEFDVRDRDGVTNGVAAALKALGGTCDAVVANAGVVDTIHRAERFPEEAWRKDLEVNLYGAFTVAQAAFDALARAGDARVILISSVAAEHGLPGQVAYGASKAGLVGMARTLAAEWARHGIRANAVCPGVIDTPMLRMMDDPAAGAAYLRTGVPQGRLGSAEEVAAAVVFLASDDASYLTGATVPVDGGVTAI